MGSCVHVAKADEMGLPANADEMAPPANADEVGPAVTATPTVIPTAI